MSQQTRNEEVAAEGRRIIQSVNIPKQMATHSSLRQTRPGEFATITAKIAEPPRSTVHFPVKSAEIHSNATVPGTQTNQYNQLQTIINRNITYRPKTRESHDLRATGGIDPIDMEEKVLGQTKAIAITELNYQPLLEFQKNKQIQDRPNPSTFQFKPNTLNPNSKGLHQRPIHTI